MNVSLTNQSIKYSQFSSLFAHKRIATTVFCQLERKWKKHRGF